MDDAIGKIRQVQFLTLYSSQHWPCLLLASYLLLGPHVAFEVIQSPYVSIFLRSAAWPCHTLSHKCHQGQKFTDLPLSRAVPFAELPIREWRPNNERYAQTLHCWSSTETFNCKYAEYSFVPKKWQHGSWLSKLQPGYCTKKLTNYLYFVTRNQTTSFTVNILAICIWFIQCFWIWR